MNTQKEYSTHIRRFFRLTCLMTLPAALMIQVTEAQNFLISENNSSLGLNITNSGSGPTGLSSWSVDGVNQLDRLSFFYRIGGGQEYALDNITSSPLVNLSGNNIEVTYANATFGIKFSYTLAGYASGTGRSGATLGVNIINYQASPLDFHLFQYSDFDLGGNTGGQTVDFLKALGKFNRAAQTGSGLSLINTFTGTAIPNPTPLIEASLYNTTLLNLMDLSQTAFNSLSTNAGPGDVTYAIQYDLLLGAGESFALSEEFSLIVPEPATAALLMVAAGCLAITRRNRK